jgi:hypothetical protein
MGIATPDPTQDDFDRHYRELPKFNVVLRGQTDRQVLSEIFEIYNNPDYNPLSSPEMQKWIGNHLQPTPHTSMSSGDIVEVNGVLWFCRPVGWHKLLYTAP